MLVELGNADPIQRHADPQRRPVVSYTHIPDSYTFDPSIDTEDFRAHLTRAVMRNNGITNYPGNEAAHVLTHPGGTWGAVAKKDPTWVWSDNKDMERFLSEYWQCPPGRPLNYVGDHWRYSGFGNGRLLPPGVFPLAANPPQALLTNVGCTLVANNVGGGQVGFQGTATAAGATSLTDSAASWTTNQWAGYRVYAASVWANIESNSASVLTLDQWYVPGTPGGSAGTAPSNTTPFIIADGGAVSAWFMGITTTNISPAATDTSLTGEATTNGMGRKISTFTVTSAASGSSITFTSSAVYTYSGSGATTFYALGLFNSNVKADATDTMFWETSFSGSATVTNNGDTLTVTDTITAS